MAEEYCYGEEGEYDEEFDQYAYSPSKRSIIRSNYKRSTFDPDMLQLFYSDTTDFLIRNNGHQVKISSLVGKTVGIYFIGYWGEDTITPLLISMYEEIKASIDNNFEVVLVSVDENEEDFNALFDTMPWLAVPFSVAAETWRRILIFEDVYAHLIFIGTDGKVLIERGIPNVLYHYGVDAYPFTPQRFDFLKQQDEEAKRNQSLSSLLISPWRDYLIYNDGNQILVSELVGKTVGLYLYAYTEFTEFNSALVNVYEQLKKRGDQFEIVLIPLDLDSDEEWFKQYFETMPWLCLPFNDKNRWKLIHYFDEQVEQVGLVIIGPDGKTLHNNAIELIQEHGIDAYPFTPERIEELEKAKQDPQSLEQLLVFGGTDFVLAKGGSKVAVSELVGRNILLYFSDCGRDDYKTRLIEVYHEIKSKDSSFEVILIPVGCYSNGSMIDQSSYDELVSHIPWLAVPLSDYMTNMRLCHWFGVGNKMDEAIFISSSGRTFADNVLNLIIIHRGDVYPFTPERFNFLKELNEETVKNQSLSTLLVSNSRDYLIANDGSKVPVSELVGKTVGLFCCGISKKHIEFLPTLVNTYIKLKERGEEFEIVYISSTYEHDMFEKEFKTMPWLGLPCMDITCGKLFDYFKMDLRSHPLNLYFPKLIIISPDGKTLQPDAIELIEDYGIDAYPFSPARIDELEKAKQDQPLSLCSFLGYGEDDFVVDNNHERVLVSKLVGRNILLYFDASYYRNRFIEAYHDIKARDDSFEVIFIPMDISKEQFDECFSVMPWFYIPYWDYARINRLCRWFKSGMFAPSGIFISSIGQILIGNYDFICDGEWADEYPFSKEKWTKFLLHK